MPKTDLVRGKSAKQWAEELNLSVPRIYQLKRKNQLEDKIDGVWQPTIKQYPKYFGQSSKEWAEKFNTSRSKIMELIRNGELKKVIKTGVFPKKKIGRLIEGKNLSQWARELGITRERARQLANKNQLIGRKKDVNQYKEYRKRKQEEIDQENKLILEVHKSLNLSNEELAEKLNTTIYKINRALDS
jgi:hypothetical protein